MVWQPAAATRGVPGQAHAVVLRMPGRPAGPRGRPYGRNQQLLQSYGQLPLSFEANAGQTDCPGAIPGAGSGYALFLTSTSAVLSLEKPRLADDSNPPSDTGYAQSGSPPASVTGVALAMNLVGANPQASVAGQDQLPGTSNYFIGNDPSQWHTSIANYGQVAYQDVYPGVNLVYYGNQQQLEYDFVVAPGADPGSIRLELQGADSISLDDQGNLVLSTASGDVLEHAPVIYQEVDGIAPGGRGAVRAAGPGRGRLPGRGVRCQPAADHRPVLSYSTYLGGSGNDSGRGIAVDGSGNAYVTGSPIPPISPPPPVLSRPVSAATDAFVTKLNAAGTALIYSTYLGGNAT